MLYGIINVLEKDEEIEEIEDNEDEEFDDQKDHANGQDLCLLTRTPHLRVCQTNYVAVTWELDERKKQEQTRMVSSQTLTS